MSVPAITRNWATIDATIPAIDVTVDPTPPAAAALLAAINSMVLGVAVTPYAATGHLCWRHGYAAGAATAGVQLYYTMSIAPGALHAKFHSTDRMVADSSVTPAYHAAWTLSGGIAGVNVAKIPMLAPPGYPSGNEPSFWVGQQYPVESSNTIDDTPVASTNRMLELTAVRHPAIEDAYCSAVMAWSCRVVHLASDLAVI